MEYSADSETSEHGDAWRGLGFRVAIFQKDPKGAEKAASVKDRGNPQPEQAHIRHYLQYRVDVLKIPDARPNNKRGKMNCA